ncbi:GL16453 [Drosophila persimilis]|uniref:GL16453 n=1 Tax=Drosophila persimilis TaxID=7234 RepID=B4GWF4_DROPE|nr:GL16453 [Drosophila persimilis]
MVTTRSEPPSTVHRPPTTDDRRCTLESVLPLMVCRNTLVDSGFVLDSPLS